MLSPYLIIIIYLGVFMSNIIPLTQKTWHNDEETNDDSKGEIRSFIQQELDSISSNTEMNHAIINRLENFISLLANDFTLDLEITEKNKDTIYEIIPEIQKMQSKFDETITDIISERLILEMCLYKARI